MGDLPLENSKHESFCQHVFKGESDYIAYELAGYKPKNAPRNACRLMKFPEIVARIDFLKKQKDDLEKAAVVEAAQKFGIDKEWVMNQLARVHTCAMDGEPIVNKDGVIVGHRLDLSAANRSLELIGKELGMFVVKIKTDENDPLLALIRRVQGNSLAVVQDVSEVEDD